MKTILKRQALVSFCLTVICSLFIQAAIAQSDKPCPSQSLFSPMPNHSVRSCEEKEFDQVKFYRNDPKQGRVDLQKQGFKTSVLYKFDGDWNQRPAPLQIMKNYAAAIQKGGGEILYQNEMYVSGKVQKNGAVYWVAISTDGSGDYRYESIREETMKQEVVLTADEIRNDIRDGGKAIFYGIYFDTDKATIKPESAAALEEMAKFLKGNTGIRVYIVGHTDNTGELVHNTELSKSRAEAVVKELGGKYGVSATQLAAQGVGPLAPVASNDKEEGKAKNRRVEMVKR